MRMVQIFLGGPHVLVLTLLDYIHCGSIVDTLIDSTHREMGNFPGLVRAVHTLRVDRILACQATYQKGARTFEISPSKLQHILSGEILTNMISPVALE
jgi:hypothetical protein